MDDVGQGVPGFAGPRTWWLMATNVLQCWWKSKLPLTNSQVDAYNTALLSFLS